MADPRGGKAIQASTPFGKRTGWLVDSNGGKAPYLAGIDGLEYPQFSKGKEIALGALEKECERPDDGFQPNPRVARPNVGQPAQLNVSTIGVAMLLVHGDMGAAKQVAALANPFRNMGLDYLRNRFNRECDAFCSGDDQLALHDAQILIANRSAFGRFTSSANLDRSLAQNSVPTVGPTEIFSESEQIAKDAKRRLDAGEPAVPNMADVRTLPQKLRIAKLIESLEFAQVTVGGLEGAGDPVLDALQSDSPADVEPLLDVYEHDGRLSRTLDRRFSYLGAQVMGIVPVRHLAWLALWRSHLFDTVALPGKDPTVAELRAYWKQVRGLTPAETWFKVLATDGKSPTEDADVQRQWLEAARHITDPIGRVRINGGYMESRRQGPSAGPIAMQGEALRSKQNPSVTDLFARRAEEMAAPGHDQNYFRFAAAAEMGNLLLQWDPKHALTPLQKVSRAIMKGDPAGGEGYAQTLAVMVEARLKQGDVSAANEYGDWLRRQRPNGYDYMAQRLFLPLVDFPNVPGFQKAQQALFGETNSGWSPVSQVKRGSQFQLGRLMELSTYLDRVEEGLKDKTVLGQTVREGTMVQMGNMSAGISQNDLPVGAPQSETTERRVCDVLATQIHRLNGAPAFQPFWPTAKRDAAIADLRVFLEKHRKDMHSVLRWPDNWEEQPPASSGIGSSAGFGARSERR